MFVRLGRRGRGSRAAFALAALLPLAACASAGAPRPSPFPTAPPAVAGASTSSITDTATAVVNAALGLRGVPYRTAGDSPETGFDCSGYVRYVFARVHVDMPRSVAEQFRIGRAASLKDLRAGDLVFFTTTAPGATHVAIALGPDQFIHAPSSTGVVRVELLTSSYWAPRIVGARRILR